jgi:inhibitor of cysteine peptidase
MPRSKHLGWAVLLTAVLFLSGCLGRLFVLDEADDGSLKTIKVGDIVVVQLRGNPSGGYLWQLADTVKEAVLESLGEGEFVPDDPNVCGGSGAWKFRFRAIASGSTPLDFAYRRPWEEEIVSTFSAIIYVK